MWSITSVTQTNRTTPFKGARRIWKCVIRSWQQLRVVYFYRCLVSLSHGAYIRVIRAARSRCESSSLAFSLRELEIELYTLTQPSGYAIRRNPRRVDTCHSMRLKLLEALTALCESTFGDANRSSKLQIDLQRCFSLYFISSGLYSRIFMCVLTNMHLLMLN